LYYTQPDIISVDSTDAQPGIHDATRTSNAPTITLEKISFSYSDQAPLFDQLSLHINARETLALVGPSGAGKTTLFQLLMRFYDPQQGHILFDGVPISSLPLPTVRQQIAIVTQDPVVFASSVMENIRYGNENASDEDVISAAKQAFAHEFIDNLDNRYNTELGERGVKLSGGQKQRIAIARAILANRPILLLDEATSALDAMSERMVQQAMNRLMQGKTSIVIAHRLATVQHADRIVVMDDGKIVATGTHSELMKSDTLYREYAELQLLS